MSANGKRFFVSSVVGRVCLTGGPPFDRIQRKLKRIARNEGMSRGAKIRAMRVCDTDFASWGETFQDLAIKKALEV